MLPCPRHWVYWEGSRSVPNGVISASFLPVRVCAITSLLVFQGHFVLRNTTGPQLVSLEQKHQPERHLVRYEIL